MFQTNIKLITTASGTSVETLVFGELSTD